MEDVLSLHESLGSCLGFQPWHHTEPGPKASSHGVHTDHFFSPFLLAIQWSVTGIDQVGAGIATLW